MNIMNFVKMRALFFIASLFLLTSVAIGVPTDGHIAETPDETPVEAVVHSRKKRAVPINLSQAEITELLDVHNSFRRQTNAADMEILTWNTVLAEMAQLWAEGCLFEHGQPSHPDAIDPLGQNLWGGSGAAGPVMTSVVHAWYSEINFYDYDTDTCEADKVCGHYTQVVWSTSNELGCGYFECPGPFHYVVCNYNPPGNYANKLPYLTGHPCTQCDSGTQWCDNGLCKNDCTAAGPGCECNGLCQNCGTLDTGTCTCACADGWRSPDCTVVCEDTHVNCGNGWYRSWCVPERPYVLDGCPAYCSLCVEDPNRRLDCPVLEPGGCTDWSAWNESGCWECGGCGTRVRTRMCGSEEERQNAVCEAKYCIRGTHEPLETYQYYNRRRRIYQTKRRIRKCCYDYRRNPPRRFWRKKNCYSRGIQGWKDP